MRHFLPRIFAALRQLFGHLATVAAAAAADDPAPRYTPAANYAKACVAHALRLLAAIYAWPEFGKRDQQPAFVESMLALVRTFEPEAQAAASDDAAVAAGQPESAVVRAVRAIVAHEAVIMDLASAVHMVRLVEALARFDGGKNSHQFAGECGFAFRCRTNILYILYFGVFTHPIYCIL